MADDDVQNTEEQTENYNDLIAGGAQPLQSQSYDDLVAEDAEPITSSALGAALRRGVMSIPAGVVGGIGGRLGGAAVGTLGAGPVGTIAGGLAGGAAGAAAGDVALDTLLDAVGLRSGSGWTSRAQELADKYEHPYASFAGELTGSLGAAAGPGRGLNLAARGLGAGIQTGVEGGRELVEGEDVDPAKLALSAGAGAIFAKPRAFTQSRAERWGPKPSGPPEPGPIITPPPKYLTGPPNGGVEGPLEGEIIPPFKGPNFRRTPIEFQRDENGYDPTSTVEHDPYERNTKLLTGPGSQPDLEMQSVEANIERWKNDPTMLKYYQDFRDQLIANRGKPNTEVTQQASQGLGPEFTPLQADAANDVTTWARGVAQENPKPPMDPATGNPGHRSYIGSDRRYPKEGPHGNNFEIPDVDTKLGNIYEIEPRTGGDDWVRGRLTPEQEPETPGITTGQFTPDVMSVMQNDEAQTTFQQQTVTPPTKPPAQQQQQVQPEPEVSPQLKALQDTIAQMRAQVTGAKPVKPPTQQPVKPTGSLPQGPLLQDHINRAVQMANRRGVIITPIPEGANSPYDPRKPVYIDPNINRASHKYIKIHETVEDEMQRLGYPYDQAHKIATQAEKEAVEGDGHSWALYEDKVNHELETTEKERLNPEVTAEQPDDKHVTTQISLEKPIAGAEELPVKPGAPVPVTEPVTDEEGTKDVLDKMVTLFGQNPDKVDRMFNRSNLSDLNKLLAKNPDFAARVAAIRPDLAEQLGQRAKTAPKRVAKAERDEGKVRSNKEVLARQEASSKAVKEGVNLGFAKWDDTSDIFDPDHLIDVARDIHNSVLKANGGEDPFAGKKGYTPFDYDKKENMHYGVALAARDVARSPTEDNVNTFDDWLRTYAKGNEEFAAQLKSKRGAEANAGILETPLEEQRVTSQGVPAWKLNEEAFQAKAEGEPEAEFKPLPEYKGRRVLRNISEEPAKPIPEQNRLDAKELGGDAADPVTQSILKKLWGDEAGAVDIPQWLYGSAGWFAPKDPVVQERAREYRKYFHFLDSRIKRTVEELRQAAVAAPAKTQDFWRNMMDKMEANQPLNAEEQAIHTQFIKPLIDWEKRVRDEWRQLEPNEVPPDFQGVSARYVPHMFMSKIARAGYNNQPWMRTLGDWAEALQPRKWSALDDGQGNRLFIEKQDDGTWKLLGPEGGRTATLQPSAGWEGNHGDTIKFRGKDYTVDYMTRKELGDNLIAPPAYVANPIMAYANAIHGMESALLKRRLYDHIEASPAWQQYTSTDPAKKSDGWIQTKLENFKERNGKPLYIDPRISWVLDDFAAPGLHDLSSLSKLARNLSNPLYFMSPLFHPLNVADLWAHGAAGLAAKGGGFKVSDVVTALKSVRTQDALQKEIMQAGGGQSMFSSTLVDGGLAHTMAEHFGMRLPSQPSIFDPIAKVSNYTTPELARIAMRGSNKITWGANDTMYTALYLQAKRQGMNPEQAVDAVEKYIGSYRQKNSTFMGLAPNSNISRSLQQLANTPALSWFFPYHSDLWGTVGNVAKDMYTGVKGLAGIEGGDRSKLREPLGVLLMSAALMGGFYPLVADNFAKTVTGNKDAEFGRRGVSALADSAIRSYQGTEDPSKLLRNVFTPSIPLNIAQGALGNKDFTGKPIWTPGASTAQNVAHSADWLAKNAIPPYGTAAPAIGPGKGIGDVLQKTAEASVGIKNPTPAAVKWQQGAPKRAAQARSRGLKKPGGLFEYLWSKTQ